MTQRLLLNIEYQVTRSLQIEFQITSSFTVSFYWDKDSIESNQK